MSIEMKKEHLIQYGLKVFEEIGANEICSVCIRSGNSCCRGCEFLKDGEGCQKRNISCIAWLCGLQKHYFEEVDLLDDWERLWVKVPGKLHRRDVTPDIVKVNTLLKVKHINKNSGKLIADKFNNFIENGGNLEKLEERLQHDFVMGKL
ncbi:DNA mismatch repair protein [Peribacillus asahii]|uniref:DNA mismatch repair protein n=1 Tax=Peribacillus asahii TaxID=228899 RepID=A0A3Q9RL82_9BACI|nr:DNA mismatch repair protein [Peribacillus asahii]AZV41686.1 DNA mismatch repair protein [Peribacillus asahii]USK86032.1 DNA mismatch repair protein [Peribacillus asahii]